MGELELGLPQRMQLNRLVLARAMALEMLTLVLWRMLGWGSCFWAFRRAIWESKRALRSSQMPPSASKAAGRKVLGLWAYAAW